MIFPFGEKIYPLYLSRIVEIKLISKKKRKKRNPKNIKKKRLEIIQKKRNTSVFKVLHLEEVGKVSYVWGFGHPVMADRDREDEEESNSVCQNPVVVVFF